MTRIVFIYTNTAVYFKLLLFCVCYWLRNNGASDHMIAFNGDVCESAVAAAYGL